MVTQLPCQGSPAHTATRQAGSHLGRLVAVLTAFLCGVLAFAAAVPAAFAKPVPPPGGSYRTAGTQVPGTIVRVVTIGACPAGRSL